MEAKANNRESETIPRVSEILGIRGTMNDKENDLDLLETL